MTIVKINVTDVAGAYGPSDKVIFYSPIYREGSSKKIISTAQTVFSLNGGPGQVELAPGPVRVRFQVQGVSDIQDKEGMVPNSGTVELAKVLENDLTYTPPVVSAVIAAREVTLQARADTIAARDEARTARDEAEAASNRLETVEVIEQWVTDAAASADRAEQATSGKADKVHTHTRSQITDLPTISVNSYNGHIVQRQKNGHIQLPPSPSARTDATSKGYVDNEISTHTHTSSQITDKVSGVWTTSTTDNRVVATSGGGYLQTSKTPVVGIDVTNKTYVDNRPALFSGAGNPPSSIPRAVVGDFWLNTTTMELFKITGV